MLKTTKAVITAASRAQSTLPLQTLVDRDGTRKSVLQIIVEEALGAGVEEICVVVCPGDEDAYRAAAGDAAPRLRFVPQDSPQGYGHALWCAREFVSDQAAFLHMVGDHVYVSADGRGCAQALVQVAEAQACAVSSVQPTRENWLRLFGAVGGQRIPGTTDLYRVEQVCEKPTPTEAEVSLLVPGLRAGHYLCFFGMHVLTPTVMDLLGRRVADADGRQPVGLSPVLADLAGRERYLALEAQGRRYAVDEPYGLLSAQVALALAGKDKDEVLSRLLELLAQREMTRGDR